MKRISLIALLFATLSSVAQDKKGTIVYTETIKLDIELEGEAAAFAAMLPKETKNKKMLYFTPEATLYKNVKKEEQPRAANANGVEIMINTSEPEDITYTDLKAKKAYRKKEFMGRTFLIDGDLEKQDWKMTGKQKKILDYPCQQATRISDEDTITVWFTPAIPVASGPSELGMLPGMILEAQINSQVNIVATSIIHDEINEAEFVKPKGGKKVSKDEFEAIVKEKTKEMQEQYGGSGNNIIRMEIRD